MRHIARVLLSILCALAVTLTPAGAESAPDPIVTAVGHCDVVEAKRLIANGADINKKLPIISLGEIRLEDQTLLHLAAQLCNSSEMFEMLLNQGANVRAKNSFGATPLHAAALYENIEAIAILIQAGAEINAKNNSGSTPLHEAAFVGKAKSTTALIEAGADINATTDIGLAPLHLAAEHPKIAAVLIEAGADVNAENSDGLTPLHLAAFKGHPKVAIALIESGAYIHATSKDGLTPLEVAKQRKNEDVVAVLRGTSTPARAESDLDPMAVAVAHCDATEVKRLIAGGADVNKKPPQVVNEIEDYTLLHLATYTKCNSSEVFEALIKQGANVNAKDSLGYTPLHTAASYGNVKVRG